MKLYMSDVDQNVFLYLTVYYIKLYMFQCWLKYFAMSNCKVHETVYLKCGPKCFALSNSVLYETVYVLVLT